MHVDIECSRHRAWSRVVEDDFGQSSIQAGPSASCVPYFKACAAWKSARTRTWGSTSQVWATYMPVNLHAAWPFAQGYSVEDAEFSLTGITTMTGVSDGEPALLHNLPKSLPTLRFADGTSYLKLTVEKQSQYSKVTTNEYWDFLSTVNFKCIWILINLIGSIWNRQRLRGTARFNLAVPRSPCLFNQNLDNVTWPAGLQRLLFLGTAKVCKAQMRCQGHWVTWRLESCRGKVDLPQPPSGFKGKGGSKRRQQKGASFFFIPTTPRKINMQPENTPLEKENHLPNHHFQVLC